MLAHAPPQGGSRQLGPPHPGASRPTLGRLTPAWSVPTLGLTVRPGGCPRGGGPWGYHVDHITHDLVIHTRLYGAFFCALALAKLPACHGVHVRLSYCIGAFPPMYFFLSTVNSPHDSLNYGKICSRTRARTGCHSPSVDLTSPAPGDGSTRVLEAPTGGSFPARDGDISPPRVGDT